MRAGGRARWAEVTVIGAGPAGAITALVLARHGVPVRLCDREAPAVCVTGESLPPAARPLLVSLGLWARFEAGGHLPCVGNRSVWGLPRVAYTDFLYDPNGSGFHIDRAAFDLALRDAAVEAGAVLCAPARVLGAAARDAAIEVELERDGRRERWASAFVVDASGRAAVVARACGAVRRSRDRQVAIVVACAPAQGGLPDEDRTSLVEAVPNGWLYTARVPDGRRIVALFTDGDLEGVRAALGAGGLGAMIADAPTVRALVRAHGHTATSAPRAVPAHGSRLVPVTGERWIAAGDAACALDPLSSQGLLFAMTSGRRAARAVLAALAGDARALTAYADETQSVWDRYTRNRRRSYAQERRFAGAPYWQRRHGREASAG